MKRDLRKWLNERCDELEFEKTEDNYVKILDNLLRVEGSDKDYLIGVQHLWMDAQKQFLKDLLDDIDGDIEKLFRGKATVKGDKAQLVAYESSLKEWLKGKYHYLKRKNKA